MRNKHFICQTFIWKWCRDTSNGFFNACHFSNRGTLK
jgi:hypothetical protein